MERDREKERKREIIGNFANLLSFDLIFNGAVFASDCVHRLYKIYASGKQFYP